MTRSELRKWRTKWAEFLLEKVRNAKLLQKVKIDSVKSHACPIEPDDFASFLGQLYHASNLEFNPDVDILQQIPEFILAEMELALKQLSNLRCSDEEGIIAEMLKIASQQMKSKILQCFNDSLHSGCFEESWKHSVFQMLPILPIMYKLFMKLLYNRLAPTLHRNQSPEQHAFSPGIRS